MYIKFKHIINELLQNDRDNDTIDTPEFTDDQYHITNNEIAPKPKQQKISEGSSIRRPKIYNPCSESQARTNNTVNSAVEFKMEPYESFEQSDIEILDDSADMDFTGKGEAHMDESEDYSHLEAELQPKAGTSAEPLNEGQGMWHFIIIFCIRYRVSK